MTLRNRIFILISLIIFVVLGISIFLLVANRKKPNTVAGEQRTPTAIDQSNFSQSGAITPVGIKPTVVPQGVTVKPQTPQQVEETSVRQLAKLFVERYNTYSSDNNFQNILDVQNIVTTAYWKKISARLAAKASAAVFASQTVQAFSIASSDFSGSQATITLKTRKITGDGSSENISYGDYIVTLQKNGSTWLVSNQTAN